jgi:ssDNA thymidine ADP-ribosyltransferase, DarT
MVPNPTPILRFVHVDTLSTLIQRGGLHSPRTMPKDGLPYRAIHSTTRQAARADVQINRGPGGTIHDYVPFYFGPLSPMMLNLKTGRVAGYTEGQEPLVYCVTSAQAVLAAGQRFVFSDGHGLATPLTEWFDDLAHLDRVDWSMVYQRYWTDNVNDMDRQRRKQAEFLIHDVCPWQLIDRLVVIDEGMKNQVDAVLAQFPATEQKPVEVKRDWYYH